MKTRRKPLGRSDARMSRISSHLNGSVSLLTCQMPVRDVRTLCFPAAPGTQCQTTVRLGLHGQGKRFLLETELDTSTSAASALKELTQFIRSACTVPSLDTAISRTICWRSHPGTTALYILSKNAARGTLSIS